MIKILGKDARFIVKCPLKILQMNYICKRVEHINFAIELKLFLIKAIFNLFEDIFTITKDIHSSIIIIN